MELFKEQLPSEKEVSNFFNKLAQVEPLEFFGILQLLGVKQNDITGQPRTFEAICADLLDNYTDANRKKRRIVNKLLDESIKQSKQEMNNSATEGSNSET